MRFSGAEAETVGAAIRKRVPFEQVLPLWKPLQT